MSHFKDFKFFRSFSAKVEGWPLRKAEQLWRRLRERKIAGTGRQVQTGTGRQAGREVQAGTGRGRQAGSLRARQLSAMRQWTDGWLLVICLGYVGSNRRMSAFLALFNDAFSTGYVT